MAHAGVDTGKTISDLIARRNDANDALDETLMALRRDIDHLREENEKLLRRLQALETQGDARAPIRLVVSEPSVPAARGGNDR